MTKKKQAMPYYASTHTIKDLLEQLDNVLFSLHEFFSFHLETVPTQVRERADTQRTQIQYI